MASLKPYVNIQPKADLSASYWILLLLAYLLPGTVMYVQLCNNINPDGVAYLTIARHYADGRWMDAVNAYWSPLLSWVLSPFCLLPWDPIFSFYGVNMVLGFVALFISSHLMRQLGMEGILRSSLLPAFAAFLLVFSFYHITPDLLVVVVLLAFLSYWLKGDALDKPVTTAAWLALLYFTKAYNFFFVSGLLIFDVVTAYFNRKSSTRVLLHTTIIFLIFFMLVAPWIIAMHQKYGQWMLSGAAAFNHGAAPGNLGLLTLDIPGVRGLKDNYDFLFRFSTPPNAHAVFAWEDPPLKADFRDYQVFASWDNFLLQLRIILVNLRIFLGFDQQLISMAFFGWLLTGVLATATIFRNRKVSRQPATILKDNGIRIFFFGLLYTSGYLLLFLEGRYLWILILLGLLATGMLLRSITASPRILQPAGAVLGIAIFSKYLLFTFSGFPPRFVRPGYMEYQLGKKIQHDHPGNNRMAYWPSTQEYGLYSSWFTTYFAGGNHFNCLPAEPANANGLINKHRINGVYASNQHPIPPDMIFLAWKKIPGPIAEYDLYLKP